MPLTTYLMDVGMRASRFSLNPTFIGLSHGESVISNISLLLQMERYAYSSRIQIQALISFRHQAIAVVCVQLQGLPCCWQEAVAAESCDPNGKLLKLSRTTHFVETNVRPVFSSHRGYRV